MRLTQYFLPILKEDPAEAQIESHKLMLRCGLIKQSSAGIYSWLPLGNKVLKKIEEIVNQEQINAGHIPLLMSTIQPADLWRESGRYDDYGKEMLRIVDRHNRELLYGPTNEEQITDIFRSYIGSYKELPKTFFHIQWKFRDEVRPRYGVMRGREFLMKDGYSFDLDKEAAIQAYNRHMVSYLKTYERMGLRAIPMRADTGPIGGNYSHEFLVLAKTGESTVYYDNEIKKISMGGKSIDYSNAAEISMIVDNYTQHYARTEDTHDAKLFSKVPSSRRVKARGIEVGQIFYFGTKYSEAMGAEIVTSDGSRKFVEMGSHGIGISRLVGAIIEASHDTNGIIWPEEVTPFHAIILNLKQGDATVDRACDEIYSKLCDANFDPLYDDRVERAGVKFARADLIGVPWRISVGPRGLADGTVELKYRRDGTSVDIPVDGVTNFLKEKYKCDT
ncbi:MAG: proline--tRNA ligase [Pseudomonadota bacterium]|nr:proline--tRNA ligase [Pseudomonadota bacterium]